MADMPEPQDSNHGMSTEASQHASAREAVRRRLERRRKLGADVVTYVVVNVFLVVVWLLTDRGYFWPGWVMAGWAVFLLLGAWDVYGRRPVTEADVDAALRKHQQ